MQACGEAWYNTSSCDRLDMVVKNNLAILFLILSILSIVIFLALKKSNLLFPNFAIDAEMNQGNINIDIAKATFENQFICEKYRFIEINFDGEHGEKLHVVSKCKQDRTVKDLASVQVNIQHIFNFPPQSGEFTTEIDTKVYITNHQKEWSKIWTLKKFRFTNMTNNGYEVNDAKLVLNFSKLLENPKTGL